MVTEFKPGRMVKHRQTGELYTIDYVVHSKAGVDDDDVYRCYRLSAYDGMPMGDAVYLCKGEVR